MICAKCKKDLADCWCKDMPKRFEEVSKVMVFSPDYAEKLIRQAIRVQGMNDLNAIGKE